MCPHSPWNPVGGRTTPNNQPLITSSQLQTSSERLQSSCKGVTRVMRTRVTQIADWNNNLEPNLGMKSVLICYNHGVQWDYSQSKNLIQYLFWHCSTKSGEVFPMAWLVLLVSCPTFDGIWSQIWSLVALMFLDPCPGAAECGCATLRIGMLIGYDCLYHTSKSTIIKKETATVYYC